MTAGENFLHVDQHILADVSGIEILPICLRKGVETPEATDQGVALGASRVRPAGIVHGKWGLVEQGLKARGSN